MHSFLIIGGTKDSRMTRIDAILKDREVSAFDRMLLKNEEGSIGVAQVRDFTKKLSLAPFNGKTLAGIIEDANLLTTEAQNALLKTLEEPSPKAIILLETVNSDLLLPTIVSRCQVISLGTGEQYSDDELLKTTEEIKKIKEARIGEKIQLVDRIATDRDATKVWVDKAIAATRRCLLAEQSMTWADFIRKLLTAQRELVANVTPRLVLDAVFLENTPW